jgi:hypothetical protein
MGIFGLKGGVGTGIALSGNLGMMYNVWQSQQAQLASARAAAKKKQDEESEKALAKIEDIGLKDSNKYTRFYQPAAKEAYVKAINKAYELKTKYPNTWQNMVPELAYGLKSELSGYARASENQTSLEKLKSEGYLVPDQLFQVYNNPSMYGNIDALKSLNPVLELYGGSVGDDGSVTIYPTKPHDMAADVAEFNKNKTNFSEGITLAGNLTGNVYKYKSEYSPNDQAVNTWTASRISDPNVRVSVAHKHQGQLLAIQDPIERQKKLNEFISAEASGLGLGNIGSEMGVTSTYVGNAQGEALKYFNASDVHSSQYSNMSPVGDVRSFLGMSNAGRGEWMDKILLAYGEGKARKVPKELEKFYKDGKVVPYGADGSVSYARDIPGGHGFGMSGKKYTASFYTYKDPQTGEKSLVLQNMYEQGSDEYTVMELNTGKADATEFTISIPGYKPTDVFEDESGNPSTFKNIQDITENRAASGKPVRARKDNTNGKVEVLMQFKGRKPGTLHSFWLPSTRDIESAVLQKDKKFWGGRIYSEWLGGAAAPTAPATQTKTAAPAKKKSAAQIVKEKNLSFGPNGESLK